MWFSKTFIRPLLVVDLSACDMKLNTKSVASVNLSSKTAHKPQRRKPKKSIMRPLPPSSSAGSWWWPLSSTEASRLRRCGPQPPRSPVWCGRYVFYYISLTFSPVALCVGPCPVSSVSLGKVNPWASISRNNLSNIKSFNMPNDNGASVPAETFLLPALRNFFVMSYGTQLAALAPSRRPSTRLFIAVPAVSDSHYAVYWAPHLRAAEKMKMTKSHSGWVGLLFSGSELTTDLMNCLCSASMKRTIRTLSMGLPGEEGVCVNSILLPIQSWWIALT